jgi:hypothetical protein
MLLLPPSPLVRFSVFLLCACARLILGSFIEVEGINLTPLDCLVQAVNEADAREEETLEICEALLLLQYS